MLSTSCRPLVLFSFPPCIINLIYSQSKIPYVVRKALITFNVFVFFLISGNKSAREKAFCYANSVAAFIALLNTRRGSVRIISGLFAFPPYFSTFTLLSVSNSLRAEQGGTTLSIRISSSVFAPFFFFFKKHISQRKSANNTSVQTQLYLYLQVFFFFFL